MKKLFVLFLLLVFILPANSQIISTCVGYYPGNGGFIGDGGPATDAELTLVNSAFFDKNGNMYIADMINAVVRKVDITGNINTFAGIGTYSGFSGNGGPATAAELGLPTDVAQDSFGNIYIADEANNVILKVNTSGIITTIAGNYSFGAGYSGNGGPATAAELQSPWAITFDNSGNMYIADFGNNVIRKVNSSGIISTVAGNGIGSYSGNGGPATAAELNQPTGVAFDASNNLYISDCFNNTIRKVNSSGIISRFAGTTTQNFSGDGGPATAAELFQPGQIKFDAAGDMYIPDTGNNVIREVDISGNINTVAGFYTALGGYSGDGGPAINAQLLAPTSVGLDKSGNLYIADYGNNVIRKVSITTGIKQDIVLDNMQVYPNPTKDEITVQINGTEKVSKIALYNISGSVAKEINVPDGSPSSISISTTEIASGVYFIKVFTLDNSILVKKLEVIK